MNRSFRSTLPVPAILAAILVAGCREGTISYYEVPREEVSSPLASAPAGSEEGQMSLTWDVPADWTESAASAMRLASFSVPGSDGEVADISVTRFPDSAGGVLANVNRWRDQIDLPPIDQEGLSAGAERIEIAGIQSWLVNYSGTNDAGEPTRTTGAIVPAGGASWFFKMTGPETVVFSQLDNFRRFLGSVRRRGDAEPGPSAPASTAPMGSTPVSAGGSHNDITFEVPNDWQERQGGAIRAASFVVPGDSVPAADVSVTAFPGTVGGDLANVNRWRDQLRLPPIDESTLAGMVEVVEGNGLAFRVFDIESEVPTVDGGHRARILAAIVEHGESTWFVKMLGESRHVASQRANFDRFLRSFGFRETH